MVRLCVRLCEFQVALGRHFHLEQPIGSEMLALSCMKSVLEATSLVHVDMCRFGLKLPGSRKLIRKSTALRTTCPKVASSLNGFVCTRDHSHDTVRGQMKIKGQRMSVSTFTASYTARHLARSLLHCGEFAAPAGAKNILPTELENVSKLRVDTFPEQTFHRKPVREVDLLECPSGMAPDLLDALSMSPSRCPRRSNKCRGVKKPREVPCVWASVRLRRTLRSFRMFRIFFPK